MVQKLFGSGKVGFTGSRIWRKDSFKAERTDTLAFKQYLPLQGGQICLGCIFGFS